MPSGPNHEGSPTEFVQQMQAETQRTTSSNGTGDSNGSGEETSNTKEVVMDMCNNVILGNEKEQSKKFRQYPYP